MPRETSFDKRFFEMHDDECEKEKTTACNMMVCECSVDLKREILRIACDRLFEDEISGYLLTICDEKDIVSTDKIDKHSIKKSKSRLYRKIRKLLITDLCCIGHYGIQLQEVIGKVERKGAVINESRWHVHWHILLFSNCEFETLKNSIYSSFRNTRLRQIADLVPITKFPFNYGYIVKYSKDFHKKIVGQSGRKAKKKMSLDNNRHHELTPYISRINVTSSLFLIGFRRYGEKIIQLQKHR